jgi:hypothetical protein
MASEYMSRLVGDANAQYNRTFDINSSANRGNALVLADGRSISGGSSRRGRARGRGRRRARGSSRSRAKRGGFMGSVINQAVVPLALLGLQQTYRRRGTVFKGKSYGRKSRRRRRR